MIYLWDIFEWSLLQHMRCPGASIPSDTFLNISIQIKKTPLISAEKPMIRCRYKGGHFVIANYMWFEYIRGVSENLWALGGGVRGTWRRASGETQRKLRNYMWITYAIGKRYRLGGIWGFFEGSVRVPHKKICVPSAVSAKTAGESLRNPNLSHFTPPHTTL